MTQPDARKLADWITENIGSRLWDVDDAITRLLATWTLTETGSGLRNSRNRIGWALLAASSHGPYPTAAEAASGLLKSFTLAARSAQTPQET